MGDTPDKMFGTTTMTLGCLSESDFPNNKHQLYKKVLQEKVKKTNYQNKILRFVAA
jgi:hypothetical protein